MHSLHVEIHPNQGMVFKTPAQVPAVECSWPGPGHVRPENWTVSDNVAFVFVSGLISICQEVRCLFTCRRLDASQCIHELGFLQHLGLGKLCPFLRDMRCFNIVSMGHARWFCSIQQVLFVFCVGFLFTVRPNSTNVMYSVWLYLPHRTFPMQICIALELCHRWKHQINLWVCWFPHGISTAIASIHQIRYGRLTQKTQVGIHANVSFDGAKFSSWGAGGCQKSKLKTKWPTNHCFLCKEQK